jgi:hypothetical protein
MTLTLYSIGCPACNTLERKLTKANLEFTIISDETIIAEKNYTLLPVLEIDGIAYDFSKAVKWLKEQTNGN